MKPGDIVWVRGTVKQVTPRVLIVNFVGPAGSPVPFALDPEGPIRPEEPDPPAG